MYQLSLISNESMHTIIPFLQLLNSKIDEEILKSRLDDMIQQGYECVGVYDQGKLIGISGLWTLTKYYVGKHIEPDNVIIHPDYRGKGIGELLMQWIYEYGRLKGCVASELNCYVVNNDGIRFWMNQGFKMIGFHFQKNL
ncbi:MAG: GNAT family N-acetyltransferase [Bacteroidota bacterium]